MTFPSTPGVVRAMHVVTSTGVVPATLHMAGGRIMRVAHYDDIGSASSSELLDVGQLVVLPGLVDTHVHVNEPGRDWEGFATATRAAAAGGITTLLDMPLNSIPATTKASALEKKRKAAEGQCSVDVGFLGGLVSNNSASDLAELWARGVFGFKCFLVPSGVDEFRHVGLEHLRATMPTLAQLRAPLLVHAELPGPIDQATKAVSDKDPRVYANYLASRPASAEVQAVQMMLDLARRYQVRLHIVHVSANETLPLLREARENRMAVSAETCPHYLALDAEQIPAGATEFKCAPPIRSGSNRERLWEALQDGVLESIVSDHSPCPPAMKQKESGDFFAAWGGVASLELGMSVVWSEMKKRGLPLERLARWMGEGPARLAGLHRTKGRIAAGCQADFVLMDPNQHFTVDPKTLKQRHPVTPYAGRTLHGKVLATYLRGRLIYAEGEMIGSPRGRQMTRENS